MTAGPFAPHRSNPAVVEELGRHLAGRGTQVSTVATTVGRYGTTAATVHSAGLYEPIQSVVRAVTPAADRLAGAGRVGDLALRTWSSGVRAYNRTIDDLNTEWTLAEASDFGVGGLEIRESMSPADVDVAVAAHDADIVSARSALMVRLRSRRRDAEYRLDRVAVGAGSLLDHAGDPDVQALATYPGSGTFSTISLSAGGDGSGYDPDASWSTPEARAEREREERLESYDGADLGLDDLGEALAFIFGDPRECVGDDASVGGCAFEAVTLIPFAKFAKVLKIGKYADEGKDAAEKARDTERRADDLPPPPVHEGKQGKHIPGHRNYQEGKSYLTSDPQELAKRAGTGTPVNDVPRGQPGFKERVDYDEPIGTWVNRETGERIETTRAIIVYGKDGIHIYPVRPAQ